MFLAMSIGISFSLNLMPGRRLRSTGNEDSNLLFKFFSSFFWGELLVSGRIRAWCALDDHYHAPRYPSALRLALETKMLVITLPSQAHHEFCIF